MFFQDNCGKESLLEKKKKYGIQLWAKLVIYINYGLEAIILLSDFNIINTWDFPGVTLGWAKLKVFKTTKKVMYLAK